MQIHLLVNVQRPDAVSAARGAVRLIRDRGHELAAEPDTARALELPAVEGVAFAEADLAVTFGGDGTLIRTAQLCSERGTPILGVYYGRFGFVTQCTEEELGACLSQIFDGAAVVQPRMMLQAELVRGERTVATMHMLNEVVVQRSADDPMLAISVVVNGHRLTTYPADGVLVSTATGSTGYNLSAGGPILDPQVQAMILTAVAPHTLSARPLVLSPESTVDLRLQTSGDALLVADGQARLHVLSGDIVRVRRSPRVTNLVSVDRDDFLIKLGERLFWSKSIFGGSA